MLNRADVGHRTETGSLSWAAKAAEGGAGQQRASCTEGVAGQKRRARVPECTKTGCHWSEAARGGLGRASGQHSRLRE